MNLHGFFFNFFHKVDISIIAMPSRAAVQRATRSKFASFIVKMMMKRLSSKCHQHRILTTNKILPLGSLKRRCLKNIFSGWVSKKFKGNGRVLTRALVGMVLRRLRARHDLDTSDLSEVPRMQYLLKVARKRLSPAAMSGTDVDTMTTLPLFPAEPLEDWIKMFV